jgi:hypothetical protein
MKMPLNGAGAAQEVGTVLLSSPPAKMAAGLAKVSVTPCLELILDHVLEGDRSRLHRSGTLIASEACRRRFSGRDLPQCNS